MLPNLSSAVEIALECARASARGHGSPDVLPFHLLQGLLRETEGQAARALAEAGIGPEEVASLLPVPEIAINALTPTPVMPLHARTEAILGEADFLARELSQERLVTSEVVLFVLLDREEELRAKLQSRGLDFTRLQARIQAQRATPLVPEEPLRLSPVSEQMETARILDACANRAREALRVIEDYCRFALDDALLSQELKTLRHELTEVLAGLPTGPLLEARDTPGDVGTGLSTPREQERFSLAAVAQANLKRLQEALRSLEEFGKLHGPDVGRALEKLRYRSYTVEKAILLGTTARQQLADARLYVLLTGASCLAALDWTIQEAAGGGAQMFQLREKKLSDRELVERARNVRRWTREAGLLFILNDRPDIARLVEADGVHLGQDDLSVADARRILGPDALIGVSTHNLDQVRQAVLEGASYIGVGPTFPSATKAFDELAGLEFVRQAAAATSLPAFVLGGINLDTLPAAVAAGARRVAVSQAVCRADDPRAVAAQMRHLLDEAPEQRG